MVKLKQAKDLVLNATKATISGVFPKNKYSIFLWGPPGIGKTALVEWVAAKLGIPVITVMAVTMESVDFRGIPFVMTNYVIDLDGNLIRIRRRGEINSMIELASLVTAEIQKTRAGLKLKEDFLSEVTVLEEMKVISTVEQTTWAIPTFFPIEADMETGILFLDDMSNADPSVQICCNQLLQFGELAGHKMPPKWTVIGAGNRLSDRSRVMSMPASTSSRIINVDVMPDYLSWRDWAIHDGAIHPYIISYLQSTANNDSTVCEALFEFDPAELFQSSGKETRLGLSYVDRSYPCPRTWETLSNSMKHVYPFKKNGARSGSPS